jgi:hypothetical protein
MQFGSKVLTLTLAAALLLLFSSPVAAAPEAHMLRVDPRAAQENGNPVLTTVVEIVQIKRVSEAIAHCADDRGTAQWSCMAQALEKPYALYTPFPFPHQNAIFTAKVDGTDFPASYVSHSKWGESLQQPGVGTAWLILIDADSRMGSSFEDAKQLAGRFVAAMGPNDIVNVMFFNDQQVVKDSKWVPASRRNHAQSVISSVGGTYRASGRNRSLLTIIKSAATDGFKSLGNVGEGVDVPLHQSMVVLSSGFGGADPMTTGPGGAELSRYLTGGRFPEDNTALPKAPVPVVSVFFPPSTWDEYRMNALNFMREMANPQIGGFFTVMKAGDGGRSQSVVDAVRGRFANMFVVKWRVSCIESSITQTFSLIFNNVKPPILPDNTFKDVPVGIDPSTWPLDVNIQYSQDMAKRQNGVYPGGRFKLYGNFCWGGDKSRAEVYFLPAGQQVPTALAGADIEKAKRTQQQLIAMGMKGTSIEASDTFVEFEAPDKEKVLHGSGQQAVVRLVVYDNKAHRTSGVTADSIIQLKGTTQPFPILWVLGGAFGLVILALLIVVIVRSGGRRRAAPPPPVVAAPPPYGGYGGAGGYGGPPQGGGYGAPPNVPPGGGYGGPPQGGGYSAPAAGGYAAPPGGGYGGAGGGAPVAAAGAAPAPNQDFMYGGSPPKYGLTNDVPAQQPPPNPYATTNATRATLQGAAGVFTIVPGVEMKAGRDGAQCGILLTEPRVSGLHSTVKLEGGQLLVRDENSNNGTFVNGNRLPPGVWSPAQNGSLVRFGPVEFSVRLE